MDRGWVEMCGCANLARVVSPSRAVPVAGWQAVWRLGVPFGRVLGRRKRRESSKPRLSDIDIKEAPNARLPLSHAFPTIPTCLHAERNLRPTLSSSPLSPTCQRDSPCGALHLRAESSRHHEAHLRPDERPASRRLAAARRPAPCPASAAVASPVDLDAGAHAQDLAQDPRL